MSTASLKRRYFAKLLSNLVGVAIALGMQALITRGLGPKAYGNFSFITDFFSRLMPFFTLSTAMGFYTKLSQRQSEERLVGFYFQFTILAFMGLLLFVVGSETTGLADYFWVDQKMIIVYMAVLWAMLTWKTQILGQVADAYGLTVSTELTKIALKCLGLVIIVVLFFKKELNLINFFFYHFGMLLLLIVALIWIIGRHGLSFSKLCHFKKEEFIGYTKEFYSYSQPLFIYTFLGMIIGILDRWLLQKFGGSVQQGFFGLSYQIGAVCFLFTSAMTPLITREFSIAFAQNELAQMASLFRRYLPLLFSIAAYFGCFASIHASEITYLLGGSKFSEASAVVMIMALYPIHQTYGQLNGSIYFATGRTKLYRDVGLISLITGLPLVYVLVAPSSMMGLDAGASGLAIKFVLLQFITVNVRLFFNTKLLNVKFSKYFAHQLLCISCLLAVASLAKLMGSYLPVLSHNLIISIIISGTIYTVLTAFLILLFPLLFGLRHNDIANLASTGIKIFRTNH